jgi:hypothetical protein
MSPAHRERGLGEQLSSALIVAAAPQDCRRLHDQDDTGRCPPRVRGSERDGQQLPIPDIDVTIDV